jgi:gliding motility-associated-like protein
LIVTSDKNCVNASQEVVNINPKPTAAFNLLPANICIYDLVKTANISSGDNSFWNFGDGATASTRNPTHKYALPGTYQIQLISTTTFGCSDTITKTITIYGLPKFDFTATDTAGCPFFCTTFNGSAVTGSDPITNWHWLFNTGDASDGPSVSYCYQKNGQYSPSLVATSSHGCVDTVSKPFYIDVYPKPKPAFTVNPNEISIFQPTVIITDQSSTDVNHWLWNFGDTKTDSGAGPFTHKYTIDNSEYTVFLTVKNKYGCTDTVSLRIGVKSESTVYISNAFTPNDDGINDHFRPYCSGDYATADFEMDIYDRWGNLILKTNDLNYGWDGTLNGTTCQQDVYVYELYFTYKADGSLLKKMRGIVSLLK